ncbi:P-loop containing nucleoside triphosphate hydrolase protein [Sodiomyces alkalinus F11]|uniref:P-loop containing nucleoside triphosphate hydrolase protein n=1 Tax=Sodiomyces alkalinus (strain CBS 110278 / VKM F-3762 / F11) TaxID=1314773 RepID=A0A3N2PJP4_SODAK|nr:P-loop containing nucleoside triphosphate hydrolase protein [Sodiomyces alkalinus F11]ROT34743.1 P-loop containing nucleoside triphosphate hydrolase protein [Sodiomyces alkalinus F11]
MTGAAAAHFFPRLTFPLSESIPRSYYLGHHHAGLREISKRLSNVGLVVECRDYRVPLTSWNHHLDRAIAGRHRIVVYTHSDLGTDTPAADRALRRLHASNDFSSPSGVITGHRHPAVFWRKDKPETTRALLSEIRSVARTADSLTGLRALVVGMPNVGKSTLLNRLRSHGMHNARSKTSVARVGAQPGITRKLSTPVRILDGRGPRRRRDPNHPNGPNHPNDPEAGNRDDSLGEGVFVLDTPGVFMPYVERAEDMVKLALVGSVKDEHIPTHILADYLLYRMNLVDPALYARFCDPTNDIADLLAGVARRTGKLKAGGVVDEDAAATWAVQQWRMGNLGKFVLDDVSDETFREREQARESGGAVSLSQARKREKELRKERSQKKQKAG